MYEELKQSWKELTAPGQMFEVTTVEVRGVPVRTYALAPGSLRDVWMGTAVHADNEYLVFQDERITYTQAHQRAASIANWLARQGVKPGDRVAIAMRNYPEWLLSYWAVVSMGAVVVGMNAWWVASELSYAMSDSAPKVLVCDRERLAQFHDIRAEFPDTIVTAVRLTDSAPEYVVPWSEVLASPSQMPEAAIDPDDDACVFYTSGTTGRPKGAQLTHRGCTVNLMNVAFSASVQVAAMAKLQTASPSSESTSAPQAALIATPLFHVTANNCLAHALTAIGGKLVSLYKWDAGEALRIIEQEKITTFTGVPMMSREMLMHPDFATRDTSSLKSMGGGGAALQPDLTAKLDKTLKNASPNVGYGMTEVCGVISGLSGKFLVNRPSSVGPAAPTFEAKCVDAEGNTLPVGEAGELWVRGASVVKGYLNCPEATAEAITDGWLHTGDIAYMDEDEFIYLVDRAKDMVLRGGENVYCAEVESALFSHEDVAECVVFAVPDDRLEEEVAAAIYPKAGRTVDVDAVRGHCKELLASYKVPRYIWIVAEPLPRNASGKFVKAQVKEALDLADAQ